MHQYYLLATLRFFDLSWKFMLRILPSQRHFLCGCYGYQCQLLMKVLMSNLHQSALEWFYFIKMSHFENAKASYTKYAFFKTKINFAVFYQCIWIGAPEEHDILPTAKLLGFFFFLQEKWWSIIIKFISKKEDDHKNWKSKDVSYNTRLIIMSSE